MSKTVHDFYYDPPSVYPVAVTYKDPAFATSNSEVYGPNEDRDVFRRSVTYRGKHALPVNSGATCVRAQRELRRSVLDSADYYVASSLRNTQAQGADDRHYSRTLAEKGFSGLPIKPELAAEEMRHINQRVLKRNTTSFVNTANNSLEDSRALFTTSTKFKALEYTRNGSSDDMRRSMHDTLRNTQNARFQTYKRSFGQF